jgi:hypothetical protein
MDVWPYIDDMVVALTLSDLSHDGHLAKALANMGRPLSFHLGLRLPMGGIGVSGPKGNQLESWELLVCI